MATIGFVGLGNMGAPMAANLVRHGHAVHGYDLSPAARDQAAGQGVTVAHDAAAAVQQADAVITMLPAGRHVLAAYEGLLPAAPRGALFIDCSTIDVASARQAHGLAEAAGMRTLDAPVSGGTGGRPPARSPSWPAEARRPLPMPSRSCRRWASASFTAETPGQGRRRRYATT